MLVDHCEILFHWFQIRFCLYMILCFRLCRFSLEYRWWLCCTLKFCWKYQNKIIWLINSHQTMWPGEIFKGIWHFLVMKVYLFTCWRCSPDIEEQVFNACTAYCVDCEFGSSVTYIMETTNKILIKLQYSVN